MIKFATSPKPFNFQRTAMTEDRSYLISKTEKQGYRVTVSLINEVVGLRLQGKHIHKVNFDLLREAVAYCTAYESDTSGDEGKRHRAGIDAAYGI